MIKLRVLGAISIGFLLVSFCLAQPWGFFAHRKVNELAVFAVPDPLHDFLREHIEFISDHAVDPDKRRHAVKQEAERHYFDLDHYSIPIATFKDSFPLKWQEAVVIFTEDSLRAYGIAPWNALWYYQNLVGSFKEKDIENLLRNLSDFGHYVGDIHVPLHTTENYNGQLTGQDGIHGFWESRLPELFFEDYELLVAEAEYVEDPLTLFWDIVIDSHQSVAQVFDEESELATLMGDQKYTYQQRGERTIKAYSESYAQAYHDNLNGMVERRLAASIHNLASLWYSAWVDAGQPDMDTFH